MTTRYPLVLGASKEPQQLTSSSDELVLPADPVNALGAATRQFVLAQIAAAGVGVTQRTVTSSTTLVSGDGLVWANASSANNVTIPPNSSVAFAVPSIVQIVQIGAGKTTILAGSGVTLIGEAGTTNSLRTVGAGCTLIQKSTDTWYVVGEMDNGTLWPLGLYTASQALAAGDLINTYNNSGTFTCRKADAASANKFEAHGFVISSVSSSGIAQVYTGILTGLSSLVGGAYFLSATTPGAMVTKSTAGAYTGGQIIQQIGIAVSATALMFNNGFVLETA